MEEKVEISTIHSFLYKNIVKPYGFLVKDEDGKNLINLEEMDGHDEHIPNRLIIDSWIENELDKKRYYLTKPEKINDFLECLKNFDWVLNNGGSLDFLLRPEYIGLAKKIRLPRLDQRQILAYKKYYWKRGVVHHEDILYFAYRILTEQPKVTEFLSCRFPYIFIDEFQDTNPIQTTVVKKLASNKTIVGVIGDSAQSIYRFQGARREDFESFSLKDLAKYTIPDNWRSTNNIIDFLQKIRNDGLAQKKIRNIEGNKVTVLVGDKLKALKYAYDQDNTVHILARRNETVGQLKSLSESGSGNIWDIARSKDSNFQRQMFIYSIIITIELMEQKKYEEALRVLLKIFKSYSNGDRLSQKHRRSFAIKTIEILYSLKKENLEKTIFEYHNEILDKILELFDIEPPSTKITKRGKRFYEFANQYTYRDMLHSIRFQEDESKVRTIHKAKGCEFNTVLIVLEE